MSQSTDVLGVVLAGGLSRRMGGGDKSLMPLNGKPILAHCVDRLSHQTQRLVINANGDPNRFASFEQPIVPDTVNGFAGPLAGILAGLRYAEKMPHPSSFIISVAADTPFFPKNLVNRLSQEAATLETIVLATSNGRRHPTFGLWPVSLADDLEEWLCNDENRKVMAWVQRHGWTESEFETMSLNGNVIDPFFNINTPEDFVQAQTLLEVFVS